MERGDGEVIRCVDLRSNEGFVFVYWAVGFWCAEKLSRGNIPLLRGCTLISLRHLSCWESNHAIHIIFSPTFFFSFFFSFLNKVNQLLILRNSHKLMLMFTFFMLLFYFTFALELCITSKYDLLINYVLLYVLQIICN